MAVFLDHSLVKQVNVSLSAILVITLVNEMVNEQVYFLCICIVSRK